MSILALTFLSLSLLFAVFALSSLSLEKLDLSLKVISVVLAGMTVMVGIGAFVTGEKLGDIQKERIAILEKETAEARTKQAEAEERLENIRKRQEPRWLGGERFVKALEGNPKGTAIVVYNPNDPEAYSLAYQMWGALSRVGWNCDLPQPAHSSSYGVPPLMARVTIRANDINGLDSSSERDTPLRSLHGALSDSLGATEVAASRDDSLPDNTFRILVGPKS